MLFDLDGTLVHHINPRVLQLLEFLDDCSHRGGRLVARLRLMRRRAGNGKLPKLLVHRAIHKVRRKSVEEMLVPCQTMHMVLERLKQQGVTLCLVSNGLGRGYGRDVLRAFDLERYFSACVFREDVLRGKPWPDSIVSAVRSIGRDLRHNDVIWYVGDQRKDIAAALAATNALGRPVAPIALGARAALGVAEARLPSAHIMWSAGDLERTLAQLFPESAEAPSLTGIAAPAL